MWPNEENEVKADDDEGAKWAACSKESSWEMQSIKSSAHAPYTPRTQAFHNLNRQLPREQPKQAYA